MSNYIKIITAVLLLAAGHFTALAQVNVARANRITPTVEAVAKVLPSVVNLSTRKILDSPISGLADSGVQKIFSMNPHELLLDNDNGYSLGSGIIIDRHGLIITNAHVVHRAVKIRAILNSGRDYDAKVIASDQLNDIALLKISGLHAPLDPIEFASPGDLLLGETVIAVGNPFGLGSSISRGVLSAIGRRFTYRGKTIFSDILQTDANILPGSSGGPLININGRMIGITSAVLKNASGIGFVIPLQRVENIIARWMIPERFQDVAVGIVPAVKRLRSGELLFYLSKVSKNSPAWNSGLRPETRITGFNGKKLDNLMDVCRILWQMQDGESFTMESGSKSFRVTAEKIRQSDVAKLAEIKLGIGVQPLTASLAMALGFPFKGGLLISDLPEKGIAHVERGDLLLQLGDFSINSMKDLGHVLRNVSYGDKIPAVLVKVKMRNGKYKIEKKYTTFTIK
ncbi:trypsin-like peptidase domain-containing protein [Lentisphaerota bacterium ZTH]|nr:trypsin-like peptidase domain-containing protein [Lentisphaerota bacterium]WET06912.1 trypsin-like peptidase domain-containing protein [Lentisphaerota bacterium ZTH]